MKRTDANRKRGMVLLLTFLFLPLAVIAVVMVAYSIRFGSAYSLQSQSKARAFYLAESGLNVAYRIFQSRNFSEDTHLPDGSPRDDDDPVLLKEPRFSRDPEGWYVWTWTPGDPTADSFTRSSREEEFRFQIVRPTPRTFRIVCRARVGQATEAQMLEGALSSVSDFVVFDNGDLADFTNSYNEKITGNVHANGDIYIKPLETKGGGAVGDYINPTLTLNVESLTSGGRIIRYQDPWGNQDDGGTVNIKNTDTGASSVMQGVTQGASYAGKGNAYDSYHQDWNGSVANPNSAVSRWDGAVADRSMGVQTESTASPESFKPGGYYSNKAGLTIDSSTTTPWISEVEFYNYSEERTVKVKEIDLAAMAAAGAWPENGLIYSEEPVRLVNGAHLQNDLTVVSTGTVYIKGDFNKKYPTEQAASSGTPQMKKTAVITPDRIYRLTSSFDDHADAPNILDQLIGAGKATDPPLHALDDDNTLEINGSFVDGVPVTSARAWVDEPDNPYFVPTNGTMGMDRPIKQVSFDGLHLKLAYPQSEALLENLQNIRLVGTGSIAHLKMARMAKYDNSNASQTVTPWLVSTSYIPPRQEIDSKPGREFEFDPSVAPDGGLDIAPFCPMLGRKERWSRIPVSE